VSVALLHSRPASLSNYAHALAEDLVAWDQRGCMSPSAILVSSRALADDLLRELLHSAFPAVERRVPPPPSPTLALQAAQQQHVGVATFLGASLRRSSTVRLLDYPEPCAHALTTPGGRTISLLVYPDACALKQFLMPWSERLSTVSAPPVDQDLARALRPFRVCLPGEMQFPRLDAHHDGYPPLARLLRRFT